MASRKKSTKKATKKRRSTKPDPREQAIAKLAAGESCTDVASALKIDRSTLYRWRQDPDFQSALEATRDAILGDVDQLLLAQAEKAVGTLVELCASNTEGIRLKAATAILDRLPKPPKEEAPAAAIIINPTPENVQAARSRLIDAKTTE